MKTLFNFAVLILCLSASFGARADSRQPHFALNLDQIKIPFYAETVMYAERDGKCLFNSRTKIWFRNPRYMRLERVDKQEDDMCTYSIQSGETAFSTVTFPGRDRNPKWNICPAAWMGDDIVGYELLHHFKTKDAVLLGTEQLQGFPVEHWRWLNTNKKHVVTTTDFWLSTDNRIPLVLKFEIRNVRRHVRWEMSQIHLGPIPDYVFTPQIHPKSGLLAALKMPSKPLWAILLLYAAILLTYLWFVAAIMSNKSRHKPLSVASSYLAILVSLKFCPRLDAYHSRLTGLPVFFSIALMMGLMFYCCVRKFGMPGEIRLRLGENRLLASLAIVAACLFAAVVIGSAGAMARVSANVMRTYQLPIKNVRFLPETLATVLVYALIWAALEEIVFRGYLIESLRRRFTKPLVINLIQSLVFTFEHIPRLVNSHLSVSLLIGALFGIFVFGLTFGLIRLKTGNLTVPWLIHAAYNTAYFYISTASAYWLMTMISRH